ncbi:Lactose transport system permease protein LacF [subsurface metagenome]
MKEGIGNISWLTDPKWAMPGLIIMSIWKGVGFNMVLFLAGLKNISKIYYEAAEIDGASSFKQFISITIPLLSPTTFFVIITTFIHSFQIFEQAYIMFSTTAGAEGATIGGGPNNACLTLVTYLYNNAFKWQNAGYASAQGIFLLAILLTFTFMQLKLQKKWVHYES